MVGPGESELLRLIPAIPFLAAVFHGLVLGLTRRESPRLLVALVSCGAVLASFAVSIMALFQLLDQPTDAQILLDDVYTWIGAGRFSVEMAFQLDPLSAVMVLVVSGVGSLIHVYSAGYMDGDHRDDKGYQRFFCYLNLFTAAMLTLVLGDNLVVLFLGWEGVGLCSYLLIGFWYGDAYNAWCGSKAFLVNRIGDFGFLVGILLLFWAMADAGVASVAFRDLEAGFTAIAGRTLALPWIGEARLITVAALCLFLGAVGKSAQLPLYVWLPDAMAGPTPVSALIHAATMVTAGVYMVCRLSFLYAASPEASAVLAWTGAVTALFAATIAIAQSDIKKVLAYSTVSQLGYMFLALGCAGYSAAVFHLVTHAFFKALLFLGAGAVILALAHDQDIDRMGGLRQRMLGTWITFWIGVAAIVGVPPLSGFFSKDAILVAAWTSRLPGHTALFGIGLATAGLTGFYMLRLVLRVFHGEPRGPAQVQSRAEDPPDTMMLPLYGLAFLSFFGGFLGLPQVYGDAFFDISDSNSLAHFLEPVVGEAPHEISHSAEIGLAALAVAASACGAALAWLLYVRRPELPARFRASAGALCEAAASGYWIDDAIDRVLVRPLVWVSDRVLFRGVDGRVIDGIAVHGTAHAVVRLARGSVRRLQTGLAQSYLFLVLAGALAVVGWMVS